jgi:hypothetical protein
VADIYKSRWEVEVFFKFIKQNLKIRSVLGHSMNAVASQGFVALCVYLLVAFQKFVSRSAMGIQAVLRLVQLSLFQRKPSTDFLRGRKQPPRSPGASEAEGRLNRPAVQPNVRRVPYGYHASDTMLTTTALGIVRDYVAPLGKRIRVSGTVKSMGEGRQTRRVTNW